MGLSTVSGPWKSENGFIGNQVDANGNEVIIETGVASAVNEITVTNAATGNAPSITSSGETNVGLDISSKGTGSVTLWTGAGTREALILANTASAVNEVTITQAATGNAPLIAASGETNVPLSISSKGTGTVTIWTGNGSREALIMPNVASAVNEYTITQAAAGTSPTIAATGGDTNISIKFTPKGTGQVVTTLGQLLPVTTVTTLATAGAVTFTAAQFLGGLILRDTNGANRADVVPSASLMVAAIPGAVVGTSFKVMIRNTSGGAETITLTPSDGATTISGTATIGQNNSKEFLVVLTNVTGAAEAYTAYSFGTGVT